MIIDLLSVNYFPVSEFGLKTGECGDESAVAVGRLPYVVALGFIDRFGNCLD